MTDADAIAIWLDTPVAYQEACAWQELLVQKRIAGAIPDAVLFLEHLPVVTIGNRGRQKSLLLPPQEIERRGITVCQSTRGGDVTYHGPGQLVMYPILRLGANEADAHGYLHNLEEIAIRVASDFGVTAYRRPKMTGAWTASGKLAAIGIRLRRWVTSHGMSFNVNPDLDGFKLIIPCGLAGEKTASLKTILGDRCPPLAEVRRSMTHHFAEVCCRPIAIRRMSNADFSVWCRT